MPDKKDLSIIIAIAAIALLVVVFFMGVFLGWWHPKKNVGGGEAQPSAVQEGKQQEAKQELDTLTANAVKEDVVVPGVTIATEKTKKTIKNTAEGYTMEIPLTMLVARSIDSSNINLYEPDENGNICGDPACPALISISTRENQAKLSLDQWTQKEEKRVGYAMFKNKETLSVDNQKVYRIEEETLRTPATYYYFLASNTKVYEISIGKALEPAYRTYLESFKTSAIE